MGLSLKTNIIIISVVFSIIPTVAVILRFWARIKQRAGLSKDDYLIVPGLIFSVGLCVTQIVAVIHGNLGGHIHMDEHGVIFDQTLIIFLQTEWATQILSILSLVFTKLSIVFFYRRIFVGETFSLISWVLLGIISVWGLSFFFATVFQCMPVRMVWETMFGTPEHAVYCYNSVPMFIATAITNMIVDIAILTVPMPFVWRLNMPMRQKFILSGIFLLGAFVVGISIARIYFFYASTDSYASAIDITVNIAPTLYWTMLEAAIAVTSACLPTMRPLFLGFSVETLLYKIGSRFTPNASSFRSQSSSALRSVRNWDVGIPASSNGFGNRCEVVRLSSVDEPHLELQSQYGIVVQKTVLQSENERGGI